MKREFARPEDREALKAVYRICFPEDSDAFWDLELDRRMRGDTVLIYRENGRILSCVQLLPETLTVHGKAYPVQYIYAAATLPECQGRGLMGALLEEGFRIGAERKQRFSVLLTQNDSLFGFYARFGYRDSGKIGILSAASGASAGCVRPARPEDVPQMLELYQQQRQGIASVARTEESIEQQRQLYGKDVVVLEAEGAVKAYGFQTDAGCFEVMGPEAAALLAACGWAEGATLPLPGLPQRRNGCIRPLDPAAAALLEEQTPVYLNLMWN